MVARLLPIVLVVVVVVLILRWRPGGGRGWDPAVDTRVDAHETERERADRARREWLARMDTELDRRLARREGRPDDGDGDGGGEGDGDGNPSNAAEP